MTNYAIIRNGVVENVIVIADGEAINVPEGTTAVAATADTAIGGTYSNGTFVRPAEPARPPKRVFTPNEFMARLTDQELDDLIAFGTSGPAAAKRWYAQFIGARDISIDDQRTADGLAYLVANGKLTSERRTALLQPV